MYKLIQLPKYNIIVSDEEIKDLDFVYNKEAKYIRQLFNKHNKTDFDIKVIAGYNNLPSIDYSMLSEEDAKKIGWININKLALDFIKNLNQEVNSSFSDLENKTIGISFIKGFKTAQSLNEKKFTLEDIENAWENGRSHELEPNDGDGLEFTGAESFEDYLNTLVEYKDNYGNWYNDIPELKNVERRYKYQSKIFDIEIETETIHTDRAPNGWETLPKITNNLIKITKIL